jgi:hypothetical protein
MRGEPKTAESTFPALSAVLSVPVLGDLLKYSMSFDDMHEHLFLWWTYAGWTLKVAENREMSMGYDLPVSGCPEVTLYIHRICFRRTSDGEISFLDLRIAYDPDIARNGNRVSKWAYFVLA